MFNQWLTLQETLFEKLPESVADNVGFGKVLTGIRAHSDGGATCEFSDGSSEGPFDLVVGCDGIKSAVKEYVDTGKISEDPNTRENCGIYSGIRIRYAIQDGDTVDGSGRQTDFQQVFGDGAYAFCGALNNFNIHDINSDSICNGREKESAYIRGTGCKCDTSVAGVASFRHTRNRGK